MSYNIDSMRVISGNLTITRKHHEFAMWRFNDAWPEGFALESPKFDTDGVACVAKPGVHSLFYGSRSGNFYNESLHEFASYLDGSADLVVTWEGGDSFSGLRFKDGEVTEMDVAFSLVERGAK